MKTIQAIKSPLFFDVIPLNNADIFLLQDGAIPVPSESLKEYLVFHDLNYVFEQNRDIIFLF